jgi:hypothetical protein
MLSDYRNWLEGELELLGNASHHAYAFGQANMAKRALEQLDAALADELPLGLSRSEAAAALVDLDRLAERDGTLSGPLAALRAALAAALT